MKANQYQEANLKRASEVIQRNNINHTYMISSDLCLHLGSDICTFIYELPPPISKHVHACVLSFNFHDAINMTA